jgi:hypothetical protein
VVGDDESSSIGHHLFFGFLEQAMSNNNNKSVCPSSVVPQIKSCSVRYLLGVLANKGHTLADPNDELHFPFHTTARHNEPHAYEYRKLPVGTVRYGSE